MPLLVCKGFANDAARVVAGELEVNVIEMSEFYLLLEPQEIETIVRKAMRDVLDEYGIRPISKKPPSEEIKVLTVLANSSTNEEAASSLGISERDLGMRIGRLREEGYLIGANNYESLREISARLLGRYGGFTK